MPCRIIKHERRRKLPIQYLSIGCAIRCRGHGFLIETVFIQQMTRLHFRAHGTRHLNKILFFHYVHGPRCGAGAAQHRQKQRDAAKKSGKKHTYPPWAALTAAIVSEKISLLPQTPYSVQQHDFQPETLPLRSELQYILQKRIVPHLYPGVVGAESFRVKPSLVARVQKAELRQAGK